MKPGTYTQMYVQLVFAVKKRDAILKKDFRERVFKYISGIITNLKHKSMIVNGASNHVHAKNEIEFDQQFLFDFWDDYL
jgi:putative transposase